MSRGIRYQWTDVPGSPESLFESSAEEVKFWDGGRPQHKRMFLIHDTMDRIGEEFPIAEGGSLLKPRQQDFGPFHIDPNWISDQILSSVLFERWHPILHSRVPHFSTVHRHDFSPPSTSGRVDLPKFATGRISP